MKKLTVVSILILSLFGAVAQSDDKQKEIIKDSNEAKAVFLKKDEGMSRFFNGSYGYVIFPNVGKGGLGIGGAAGNGTAYKNGNIVGMAKLTQVSIGFQAGGQAFREVIFFETKKEFDRFKENKIEFTAQVSAVAAAAGVSANAKYVDGIAIFTLAKGGLMYEASVAGQKFKFKAL